MIIRGIDSRHYAYDSNSLFNARAVARTCRRKESLFL